MKIFVVILFACLTLQGIGAEEPAEGKEPKVLLVYEESNKNIDPWTAIFREELRKQRISFLDVPAATARGVDLSSYDFIVVYGAVMAFTSKEPIRDWLGESKTMNGKKTALFVTANRWYLEKYTAQLTDALKKNGSVPIDVVSAATKKMSDPEKQMLVSEFVKGIR